MSDYSLYKNVDSFHRWSSNSVQQKEKLCTPKYTWILVFKAWILYIWMWVWVCVCVCAAVFYVSSVLFISDHLLSDRAGSVVEKGGQREDGQRLGHRLQHLCVWPGNQVIIIYYYYCRYIIIIWNTHQSWAIWDRYKMCSHSAWIWIFLVCFHSTSGSNSSDSDGLPVHLLNQPQTAHPEVNWHQSNLPWNNNNECCIFLKG